MVFYFLLLICYLYAKGTGHGIFKRKQEYYNFKGEVNNMAFCWICGNKYDAVEGQPISSKPEHKTYRICTECQLQKTRLYNADDPQEQIAYFKKYINKVKDPVVLDGIQDILAIPDRKDQIPARKEIQDTLQPCPCCGNPAEYGHCGTVINVHCPNCDLAARWCATAEEARALWNRRPGTN